MEVGMGLQRGLSWRECGLSTLFILGTLEEATPSEIETDGGVLLLMVAIVLHVRRVLGKNSLLIEVYNNGNPTDQPTLNL